MSWDQLAEAVVHVLAFVLLAGFTIRLVFTRPPGPDQEQPPQASPRSPVVMELVQRTLAARREEALALLFLYAHTVAPRRGDLPEVRFALRALREVFHDLSEPQLDALPGFGPFFRKVAVHAGLTDSDIDPLLERVESAHPHEAWLLQCCAAMIRTGPEPTDGFDPLVDEAWLSLMLEHLVRDLSELLVVALIHDAHRKKNRRICRMCVQRRGSVCERLRSRADAWTDRMAPRQFPVQLVDVRRLAS